MVACIFLVRPRFAHDTNLQTVQVCGMLAVASASRECSLSNPKVDAWAQIIQSSALGSLCISPTITLGMEFPNGMAP